MVRNLLANAFGHATSTVFVTLRASPGREVLVVVLAIKDDGPGVPVQLRELVFGRSPDSTRPGRRGTAAAVWGWRSPTTSATRAGGTLVFEDRADHQRGARVVVRLPMG